MPNEVSIRASDIVGAIVDRRLARCRDDFVVGDFMRWEGEPGASLLVHGTAKNYAAVALERIRSGQAVELIYAESGFVGAKLA